MTKTNTKTARAEKQPKKATETKEQVIGQIEAQVQADIARPRSVVNPSYKRKYAERAKTRRLPKEVSRKAIARSNSDWLAIQLAARVLDEKRRLKVPELEAILDANGVKHDHYSRTSKNWQGRLRMSGGMALRTIVANNGFLMLPDGTNVEAPSSFCALYSR